VVSTIVVNLVLAVMFVPTGAARTTSDQSSAVTRSPHGNLNLPCQNCHTAAGWKPIRAIPEFDHNQTKFPLRGLHQGVACTQCHVKPVFTNVGQRCADCHADIHKRQFGANCEQCHTVKGWTVGVQQINQHQNRFPLLGAHASLDCDACHRGGATGQFQGLSTQCYSCHAKDYQQTSNPSHPASKFSTTCETCHGFDNWLNAKFDHSAVGFPLTGGHAVPPRQCVDCHVNNNYNLTSTTCITCHLKDFQGATNPNHVSANFPQTCQQCHSTIAWQPATFDHSLVNFALTGAHTVPPRQCTDCHVNNNYNLTSVTCVSCHLKDFQGTTNPDHAQAGFAQTCEICHSTTAWQPATFDHSKSAFPLTGMHTVPPRQCADCHVNNNYNITVTTCVSCHLKDYQGTSNPNHVTSNFPQTCEQCHNTTSWLNATFNHASTGFNLTGAHTVPPRQCTDCHVNNNYNLTTAVCASCHLKDFQGTTNPNHVTAGFPQTCEQCHDTVLWTDAVFNHTTTGFALTGMHATPPRQCADCHINGNYNITTSACVSCHLKDYQGTTNPNHVTAGFPQTCEQCHDTVLWTDAVFNHTTTGFALTGMHTVPPRQCADCHINGNYNITTMTCVSCHQTDYNNALTPVNHISAGFPTTCELCHDTNLWTDGVFNHNNTPFPLTGMHTVPPRVCADCHVNNNYTTLPTTCVGCHQADYNATSNPGHAAQPQFFPTTCQTCHTTSSWLNATFNHTQYTQFPTNHGNANGVCATCHINSNDYSVFQCTQCHGGNNPNNFHHDQVNGYVYNSVNCYQCHRNGQGGG
jgi:hypothetical protein